MKTKGRGKAGKLLFKYILKDKFMPFFREWSEERKIIMEKHNTSHNHLFIKDDGTPATSSVIRTWVAELEEFLKVPFYAHSARHYITTLLSKKNIPHNLIKEIMGWSTVLMVEVYDDTTARDKEYKELENLRI